MLCCLMFQACNIHFQLGMNIFQENFVIRKENILHAPKQMGFLNKLLEHI